MELNYENVMKLTGIAKVPVDAKMLFVLIDHSAIPDLTKQLNRMGVHWISLFDGSRDQGALAVAPILVPIFENGRLIIPKIAINWLIEKGRYNSSLQFLRTSLNTIQLSRRLTARLHGVLPDNVDIMLRYFDGRVFESLMTVLYDKQKTGFLCVSTAWAIVDRQGEIRIYDADFTENETGNFPLKFTGEQESSLIKQSEMDQVVMLLQLVAPFEYERLYPHLRFGFVTRHIAAARSYQIDTVQAQALYCSLALTSGEQFAEQPYWKAKLADVSAKRLTLFDVVEKQEQ